MHINISYISVYVTVSTINVYVFLFHCAASYVQYMFFLFFYWTSLSLVTVLSIAFYCVPNVLFSRDVNVHCLVCNLLNKMSEMNQTI